MERQTGNVRSFVESCPICQAEKNDHILKRSNVVISTEIPEEKWEQVSIDSITDLPKTSSRLYSIMIAIDKVKRMTHITPCSKIVTAVETARLY